MRNSFLIAIRNLFGERGRLVITAGGVAFSVTLILVLLGLYQGWNNQITRFLGSIDADYWVGQQGSRDISHSVSLLPANMESSLRRQPSIDKLNIFVGRQVSFKKNGKEIRVLLVGTKKDGIIKPYKIVKGKEIPDRDEIIIDEITAKQEKLKIGDEIEINGTKLKIVGISSGGNILIYSYAFADLSDTRKILGLSDFTNFFLISSNNRGLLEADLKSVDPNLEIMTKQEFLDNNSAIIKDTFLPIIGVLLLIAVIIGIVVIGLTIYTATIEKSQEYGVLKAIGYSNSALYIIAFLQSMISGIIGLVIGNLLTIVVVWLAKSYVGNFIYEVGARELIAVAVLTLAMAILASLIPLKRLFSIDPANVFKA